MAREYHFCVLCGKKEYQKNILLAELVFHALKECLGWVMFIKVTLKILNRQ